MLGKTESCCYQPESCTLFEVELGQNNPCCTVSDFQWEPEPRGVCNAWFHNEATITFDCDDIRNLYKEDDNIGISLYRSVNTHDGINQPETSGADGDTLEVTETYKAGNLTVIYIYRTIWHVIDEYSYPTRECILVVNGTTLCKDSYRYVDYDPPSDFRGDYADVSIIKRPGGTEAFYRGRYIGTANAKFVTGSIHAKYTGTDKWLQVGARAIWTKPDKIWLYDTTSFDKFPTLTKKQTEQVIELGKQRKIEERGCPCPTKIETYKYVAHNLPNFTEEHKGKNWECAAWTYTAKCNYNLTTHEWRPCSYCCGDNKDRKTLALCKIGSYRDKGFANCFGENDTWDNTYSVYGSLSLNKYVYNPYGAVRAVNWCGEIPYGYTYKINWSVYRYRLTNLRIIKQPDKGSVNVSKECIDGESTVYTMTYTAPDSLPEGTCSTTFSYELTGRLGEKSVGYITLKHYHKDNDYDIDTEFDLYGLPYSIDSLDYEIVDYSKIDGGVIVKDLPNGERTSLDLGWSVTLYRVGNSDTYKYYEGASGTCHMPDNNGIWRDDPKAYYERYLVGDIDEKVASYNKWKKRLSDITITRSPDVATPTNCGDITALTNAFRVCSDKNVKEAVVSMAAKRVTYKHKIVDEFPEDMSPMITTETLEKLSSSNWGTYTVIITKDSNPPATIVGKEAYAGQTWSAGVSLEIDGYSVGPVSERIGDVRNIEDRDIVEDGKIKRHIYSEEYDVLTVEKAGVNITMED